jgi:hypothetical protein
VELLDAVPFAGTPTGLHASIDTCFLFGKPEPKSPSSEPHALLRPLLFSDIYLDLASQPTKAYLLGPAGDGVVVTGAQANSPRIGAFAFTRGTSQFVATYRRAGEGDAPRVELVVFPQADLQPGLAYQFPFDAEGHLVRGAIECITTGPT